MTTQNAPEYRIGRRCPWNIYRVNPANEDRDRDDRYAVAIGPNAPTDGPVIAAALNAFVDGGRPRGEAGPEDARRGSGVDASSSGPAPRSTDESRSWRDRLGELWLELADGSLQHGDTVSVRSWVEERYGPLTEEVDEDDTDENPEPADLPDDQTRTRDALAAMIRAELHAASLHADTIPQDRCLSCKKRARIAAAAVVPELQTRLRTVYDTFEPEIARLRQANQDKDTEIERLRAKWQYSDAAHAAVDEEWVAADDEALRLRSQVAELTRERDKAVADLADLARKIRAAGQCKACRTVFDSTDQRFDGAARHPGTSWCKRCVDRCHEATDFAHRCPVCNPESGEAGEPWPGTAHTAALPVDAPSPARVARVWQKGDPEPDDTPTVRDCRGSVWLHMSGEYWDSDKEGPFAWRHLVSWNGPLREVIEGGDSK